MLGYDAGSVAKLYTQGSPSTRLSGRSFSHFAARPCCCAAAISRLSKDSEPIPQHFYRGTGGRCAIITLLVIIFNVVSVRRKVRESWRR